MLLRFFAITNDHNKSLNDNFYWIIAMSPCQTYIETLRSRGFRITPQREMIVEAIAHQGNHINADEVFARIQERTHAVNIATVYRTLDLLVEQGLASRIDLEEGQVVYATHQHGSHIHLVCRQCSQVIDADQNLLLSLNEQLTAEYQFAADVQHISVLGLCSDCQII
jgi:Fur family transcriptional regulator, ferric uptake regulator